MAVDHVKGTKAPACPEGGGNATVGALIGRNREFLEREAVRIQEEKGLGAHPPPAICVDILLERYGEREVESEGFRDWAIAELKLLLPECALATGDVAALGVLFSRECGRLVAAAKNVQRPGLVSDHDDAVQNMWMNLLQRVAPLRRRRDRLVKQERAIEARAGVNSDPTGKTPSQQSPAAVAQLREKLRLSRERLAHRWNRLHMLAKTKQRGWYCAGQTFPPWAKRVLSREIVARGRYRKYRTSYSALSSARASVPRDQTEETGQRRFFNIEGNSDGAGSIELEVALDNCLAALKRDDRELLYASLDGRGPSELAKASGVPEGTLSSRLKRARTRLKECLWSKGFRQ